jgi:thioesterase domain-containing protein
LAVRLFSEIHRVTGVDLPLATLFHSGATLQDLAQAVRSAGNAAPTTTLVALQPNGVRAPFYCVPGAGSDVSALEPLARGLGTERPFFGLQYPGVDGVEAPAECIVELARRHLQEVTAHQPEGPYYLGGTSGGGIVAFELARQLEACGRRVALLALLDTHAPGYPVRKMEIGVRLKLNRWLRRMLPVGNKKEATPANLAAGMRQRYARWAAARASSRRPAPLGAQPHEVRYFQLLDAFIRATRQYTVRPYAGTLTLFRTEERLPEELFAPDPMMGWGHLAEGGISIVDIPGHHGAHIKEPFVGILAAKLRVALSGAEEGVTEP